MLNKKEMSDLREKLLQRRSDIFEFRRTVNTSWQALHEPESELEETASKETLSRELAQLDDRGQVDIRSIDEALTKMDEGQYGKCEACRKPIATKTAVGDALGALLCPVCRVQGIFCRRRN